jgi:hypothetical protein
MVALMVLAHAFPSTTPPVVESADIITKTFSYSPTPKVVALLFQAHTFPFTTPHHVVESADIITKLLLLSATSQSGGAAVPGEPLPLHHSTCCRIS